MAGSDRLSLDKHAFFASLGYQPHPGQRAVHRSRASRRVVACGVRWGKTRAAAMEGLAAAMEPKDRSVGWVVAPTYDLADRVYREIVFSAAEHLRHRIEVLKENERRLVLRNLGGGLSEIRAKSADNPVSLLGEGLDWLVVDEAARLKPAIWQGHLTQRLLDRNGWALLISTPRGKGWFYDLFRLGQRREDLAFESWNSPTRHNPHVSDSLIEAERSRLPERTFLQEYEGQFIEGSGSVFRNVRESATGSLKEPEPGPRTYGGLDLAKVEDYTVLVILNRDREVVFVDRFHRLDWSLQVGRIRESSKRYRAHVLTDSTGVGEPVFESLKKAGCSVSPYSLTSRSKAAIIDNLALLLEQRKIVLPRPELWPEGIDELESFQFTVTDAGNVKTGAPAGQHDDCVIALALAAWQLRPSRPKPRISWVRSPF